MAYGDWLYSDRWGEVWVPENVPDDFHPYFTNGRWISTQQFGAVWATDYEWGNIVFHYGRWVNDPENGWLWIPGFIWSPGWVIWQSDGHYTGWMPLPPDDEFLRGGEKKSFQLSYGGRLTTPDYKHGYYGYAGWYGNGYSAYRFARNWVFMGSGDIGDGDYIRRAVTQPAEITNILLRTHDATNYPVINNYIVNRSVDPSLRPQANREPLQSTSTNEVPKYLAYVATFDGPAHQQEVLHGTGLPNSAPRPPPSVVQTLSYRIPSQIGHAAGHLFSKISIRTARSLASKTKTHSKGKAVSGTPLPE